ncbi:hypothetical protein VSDG_00452 [Cytospora chrysosperma]|uniref:Uncharacterized protein n=1 Tax=Cytospora chrysosperma TaxID=252740 RepID=A0A423WNY8_CYTCH|nr:hypothetical protein VSDG_00452 [Valsa sordida]
MSIDSEMPTAEVMEKQQQIETVYQEEAATKPQFANVEEAISNEKDLATKHLLEQHESLKLQIAKLKDEVDAQRSSCQSKNEQLKEKEETIKTHQGKHEILQRKLEATMEELGQTKRERDCAKQQLHDYRNQLAKTQEKLNTRERELDDVKARLGDAQREVEALRIVNDKNGEHNTRIRASAERAKSTLTKERKDYKKTEHQKAELEKRCKDLRSELNTKESEWAEQVNKLVTANREILGKHGRYNNKVPDEKIKELFDELKFKIGQFTNTYPKQLPEALEKELDPIWEGFSPNARKFLKNCVLSNLLIESYIWEWLRTTVFVQNSKVWGGNLGGSLSEMLGRAQEKINGPEDDPELYVDYQCWRSSSSSFLARLNNRGYNPESCRPDAKDMIMNFLDWTSGKSSSINHHPRRYGFTFTTKSMVDRFGFLKNEAGAKAPTVDFIVSPALFKRGNNDGAGYQTQTCCIKMDVVCNTSRFLSPNQPPIDTRAVAQKGEDVGLLTKRDVKEENTDEAAIHTYSQPSFTRDVSEPAGEKYGKVVPQQNTPVEPKFEKYARGSTPGPKSGTAFGAGVCAKASGPSEKKTQKRKRGNDLGEPDGQWRP